ncbi:MAG TPA: hypothetical protein DHN33_09275 [Eubacteriaceae bacterium]|nr:hypothetical protein [Eubacteriaceae bacterium]
MFFSKLIRRLALIGLIVILLFLPMALTIHNLFLYYGVVAVFVIATVYVEMKRSKKSNGEMFFKQWKVERKKGKKNYLIKYFLISMVWMAFIVFFGQWVGNDRGPMELVRRLYEEEVLLLVGGLWLGCSAVVSFVNWHENERRYRKLVWDKDKR